MAPRVSLVAAAVVLLFVASALAQGVQWSVCPGTSTSAFKVTNVTVTPDPPVIGQTVQLVGVGELSEEVTYGTGSLSVSFYLAGWHQLPTFSGDLCNIASCPLETGQQSLSYSVHIPTLTPKGQYKGQLTVDDQNYNQILCVNFNTTLVDA